MVDIWKTKDGRKIPVPDMDDSHLCNAIAMLRRNARCALNAEINAAYACLSSVQGEAASDACESDIHMLEKRDPLEHLIISTPIYLVMLNEAGKRKIKSIQPFIDEAESWYHIPRTVMEMVGSRG